MEHTLNAIEARILGALVEKQLTTPEYYPLTLNLLKSACNQKSNREPVMTLDDKTLLRGLDGLRQKKLVFEKSVPGARVFKYEHRLTEWVPFTPAEVAVLCVLILRGPQTVGEIRGRTNRLYEFQSTDEVEDTLAGLAAHTAGVFITELPLQPGRREHRYAQLLTGEVDVESIAESAHTEPARMELMLEDERIDALEEKVAALQQELAELKDAFQAFKHQFD